jgi:hypothetical protein
MGVDAIVIIENSRNSTLDAFIEGMRADQWGKSYSGSADEPVWECFEWEGKTYFSLIRGNPRYARLYRNGWDFEGKKAYPNPRFNHVAQAAFCKAMAVAEELAGGPVYLGNDVIWHKTPDRIYRNETFLLPPELEVMVEDWRTIAALPITPEELYREQE